MIVLPAVRLCRDGIIIHLQAKGRPFFPDFGNDNYVSGEHRILDIDLLGCSRVSYSPHNIAAIDAIEGLSIQTVF